jgi:hypothetical protein
MGRVAVRKGIQPTGIKKRYPESDHTPKALNPVGIACWPCTIEASTTFLEIDMTHTFRNRVATSLRQLAVPFALSAALFVHAPAQAAGLNDASMNVSLIPVGSVLITASVVAASADSAANASKTVFNEVGSFVVRSVNASARGTVYVLERASDGARYSVEVMGKGLKASATVVGAVVSSTAMASGVMLVSAGEVLAFIPNAIGQALLHNERLTF